MKKKKPKGYSKTKADRVPKNLGGRPSAYRKAYADMAYKLCLLKIGITDEQVADFFNVSTVTIVNWKKKHPKFLKALMEGTEPANMDVASKLFERATGYSHLDTHISNFQGDITLTPIVKHYPPEYNSIRFWLTNKAGWKEKIDQVHSGSIELKAPFIT